MEKKARLLSFTQSVTHPEHSLEDQICYVARVSNPLNQSNTLNNRKLINYLLTHKHFSPLEMVSLCLEVNTTRDISRQILRHRSMSFQEFSQRYADPVSHLSFESREVRLQDVKNRQNSISVLNDSTLENDFKEIQSEIIEKSKELYQKALEKGIAKEQARVLLPEGLIKTRMYISGTLRSWLHYIETRTDPTTQKEHREIAIACADEIGKVFPLIHNYVSAAYKKE